MDEKKRRAKGSGTITKLSNGKYKGTLKYGMKPDGKPYTKSFTADTEAEVRKKLTAFSKTLQQNNNTAPTRASLETYMTEWLEHTKKNDLKPSSYDRLECTLKNNIFPTLGSIQFQAVTARDIQKLLNDLNDDGKAYSTIKKCFDALHGCYDHAVQTREATFNPTNGVTIPGRKQQQQKNRQAKELKFFTPAEQKKLIEVAMEKYPTGTPVCRYGAVIPLLINTGLRLGELLALRWDRDVDLNERLIDISHSMVVIHDRRQEADYSYRLFEQDSVKSLSGERTIYLNDKALAALLELKNLPGDGVYVISTKNGKPATPSNIERLVREICRRAKLESGKIYGPHALRHTFASNLIRHGVDIKTVSELLGHSDVGITMNTYVHLIDEQKKSAVFKINDLS